MMTDTELLIAQRVAQQVWPTIGAKTKVIHLPSPTRRVHLPPTTAAMDHFIEIHRFFIRPQIHVLMGYSIEHDELTIINERPSTLGIRQGLLQIVDALERSAMLHISPTTSELRKERKLTVG